MSHRLLIIDNYDSFTYNLVHAVKAMTTAKVTVRRNDQISSEEAAAYDRFLFSPGPGVPSEAGNMPALIRAYAETKPMLGVCLGHQAIAEAFGAKLLNLPTVVHGLATEASTLPHEDGSLDPLFADLPAAFQVGRYHSWVVDRAGFPAGDFRVTAQSAGGIIMAIRHRRYPLVGVQFRPESVLTPHGNRILANWLGTEWLRPEADPDALAVTV